MGIKRYVFLSLIFLIAVATFVLYKFEGTTYTLSLFEISLTLPVALWLIAPATVLFIVSTFHLVYYYIKSFFEKRVLKKDYETFLTEVKDTLLGEEKVVEYKTEYFEVLGKVLKKLNYKIESSTEKVGESKLDDIFELLSKIKKGEHVDLKKYKLRNANEINVANRVNLLNGDKKDIVEVLKHCNKIDGEVCIKAFNMFLEIGTYAEIKKYDYILTKDMIFKIFERYVCKEDNFTLSEAEILEIFQKYDFTSDEYIKLAKILKNQMEPNSILVLFENMQSKNQVATSSYLYLLFEFQMIDKVRDFLNNVEDDEFEKFKILLFLRDNGKLVDINLFY